jgi:hypothetical protein
MKPDRDRDAIGAITRKLEDAGCAHPDAVAREVMAIVRGRGYRLVIHPPDDWRHGGGASPGTVRDSLDVIKEACAAVSVEQLGKGNRHA